MGGDHGPRVVIPAALEAMRTFPELNVLFVGKEDVIRPMLDKKGGNSLSDRWQIQHASEVVAMDEPVSSALRSKKDSSMRVAINAVKEGRAQACVSAGNTGALMAIARFVLKTLPGIDRPAIMTRFPARHGRVMRVLDLGANVDSTAEHLYQFAVMASVLTTAISGIERPDVGLLNVGEEAMKGNEQVKKTNELLLKAEAMNYVGYVEGNDLFSGRLDVAVCDGFVGNIMLKALEGEAKLIGYYVKQEFRKNWLTKLLALTAMPVLKKVIHRMDPRRLNGATLLGLNGVVIKSHGGADQLAYFSAIKEALLEAEKNVPERIGQQVAQVLTSNREE